MCCVHYKKKERKKKRFWTQKKSIHALTVPKLHTYPQIVFYSIASKGWGTWPTPDTFIATRLLITTKRHGGCDRILAPTRGCIDWPRFPSSITQNKSSLKQSGQIKRKWEEKQNKGCAEKKLCHVNKWHKHSPRVWSQCITARSTLVHSMQPSSSEGHSPYWPCLHGSRGGSHKKIGVLAGGQGRGLQIYIEKLVTIPSFWKRLLWKAWKEQYCENTWSCVVMRIL